MSQSTIYYSQEWAISGGGSVGFVPGVGLMAYYILLVDKTNHVMYNGYLAGSAIGAGLDAGGSVSTFSPTSFHVPNMMTASDFDNSLCGMIDVGFGVLLGGSLTYLTIYGVSHSPSLIDTGGAFVGLGGGLTLSPLLYLYVSASSVMPEPGFDPNAADGGYTPAGPNQSTDPGMSVQPINTN